MNKEEKKAVLEIFGSKAEEYISGKHEYSNRVFFDTHRCVIKYRLIKALEGYDDPEVILESPTVSDIKQVQNITNAAEAGAILISNITGIPDQIIKSKMFAKDFTIISKLVEIFF